MITRYLSTIGLFVTLILPSSVAAMETIPVSLWDPQVGDSLVVDVRQNIGYLVHADGEAVSFPVATGRKSNVYYIGRYYRAETPVRTWTAEQKQIKGDRRTFGVSGRFIRLFRDGENSPYGIHSYYKVDEWMQEDQRYFSMGCIVVTEEMMDIIEKTFDMNHQKMNVVTTTDAATALHTLRLASASGRDS